MLEVSCVLSEVLTVLSTSDIALLTSVEVAGVTEVVAVVLVLTVCEGVELLFFENRKIANPAKNKAITTISNIFPVFLPATLFIETGCVPVDGEGAS